MNKSFSGLFIKFLMPYLFIIFIIFAMSSIAYTAAFNEIEENAIGMQQSYIEQSKQVLDRRFNEAIDASIQLKQMPIVSGFKKKTAAGLRENYYPAVVLHNELNDVRFVNDIIEGYFIFYKNSGIVGNSNYVNYYDGLSSNTFEVLSMSQEDYWASLFDRYYNTEIQDQKSFRIHQRYVTGIPILTTIGYDIEEPQAVIMMLLDGDKLKENMAGFEQNVGGNFFIVNDEGLILTSLHGDSKISQAGYLNREAIEENYITFEASSDAINWHYVLVQPADEVFRDLNRMRSAAFILIGAILIVGLIASFFSARYNARPVQNLMNSHDLLNERVKSQLPYIRMNFLERWLRGNYTQIDELIVITKYLRANYIGNNYCVVVIDYDQHINILDDDSGNNMEELHKKALVVRDLLTEEILQAEYIHDIDHDKLAVIFITDTVNRNEFKAYIQEQLKRCCAVIEADGIKDVHFGIGGIYSEMTDVSTSLSEALDATNVYDQDPSQLMVWYDTLGENEDTYYYPQEMENRLYNCTKAGDKDQVEQILREVLKRNVLDKTLPAYMMRVFIYDLWGTLAKVQDRSIGHVDGVQKIIVTAFEQMETMSDLEKLQYIKKVFLKVCDVTYVEREEHHDHIMISINRYVEESYMNPDFCLPMVADKFNLSYAYLSQIFKEFNDETFINYLQKLRMNEAKRLLLETNLPVKEIVTASGYNSSNTFGKAFKRMHGVSASVFREKKKTVSM